MYRNSYFIITFILIFTTAFSQKPEKLSSDEIYHKIQKLNFLGSVLYIAAHPDDENTRLISYMANHQNARTGYLSLTRGDGGQNLIGTEIRELLGVIRTQELIEARKMDGGIQFFTRANDFGYSKNPSETLKIWDQEAVLSDMTYIIRKFQPDVIITRFDHRSPGTTHGHHTSSAMLTQDAFEFAKDRSKFPDQLKLVNTWEPKSLYFNVSHFFYGSKANFEKADKSHLISFESGIYYQNLGKSNQEIAALSRSSHQSQGFGATGARGEDLEYLEFIKGKKPNKPTDFFEGIDTTWSRVKGGETVKEILLQAEKNYDFKNPSASLPALLEAYSEIQKLEDLHWKNVKTNELKIIIQACAGLFLEAVANEQTATSGDEVVVSIEAINRSKFPMQLHSYKINPINKTTQLDKNLTFNKLGLFEDVITISQNAVFTDPYWLKNAGTTGMYQVNEQENIGKPDIIRDYTVDFVINFDGQKIIFTKDIVYKYNDPVKGEVYKPFDITPKVTTSFINKVNIFNSGNTQEIKVKVVAGANNLQGTLKLQLPTTWKIKQNNLPFDLKLKGSSQLLTFYVSAPKGSEEITARSIATINGIDYIHEKIEINYDHIATQQVLKESSSQFVNLDVIVKNKNIGYIMGAGDEVPVFLTQLGYHVKVLDPTEITADNIAQLDAIVVGIRAYNTVEALRFKQDILFDFVKNGKNLIVQYNTTGKLTTDKLAPYPLKISRDRVTEENAAVRFLAPKHAILNSPNKITSKDFEGWVQEQGLYYPDQWDQAFTPIISSNDTGESPKDGAILVAKYGKGNYIYTGLSFFRELPAGVPGAYRLLANMIALTQDQK